VPTGILSALRKGSWLDYLSNVVGLAGLSVPPFWLGLMLILLVSVDLGRLPACRPSSWAPMSQAS